MMRYLGNEPLARPAAEDSAGWSALTRRFRPEPGFEQDLEQVLETPRRDQRRESPPRRNVAASHLFVAVRTGMADAAATGGTEKAPERRELREPARADGRAAATGVGLSSADRYWAAQPEPVRVLRYAKPEEREGIAQQLAQQGYAIDAPIMVWGWDPEQTMRLRMEYGYTWVPSAFQPQIQVAPGLVFPGLPSYDPAQIPPGAIRVNLDFLNT
jgi:hypothetical protein